MAYIFNGSNKLDPVLKWNRFLNYYIHIRLFPKSCLKPGGHYIFVMYCDLFKFKVYQQSATQKASEKQCMGVFWMVHRGWQQIKEGVVYA